jgi:hypothetical protein
VVQEINIGHLLDEVEPVLVLRVSKDEVYEVHQLDGMPVEIALRVADFNSKLSALGVELREKQQEIDKKRKGLKKDDPRHKVLDEEVTVAEMRMLPLLRDYVEAVAQMPPGRLKRMSTAKVSEMFNMVQNALSPRTQQQEASETIEEGKSEPQTSASDTKILSHA